MDEELLNNPINDNNILNNTGFIFNYPIYDQANNLIENPDLALGYLKKETFTIYHESTVEQWHYAVKFFEFKNGEVYIPVSEEDPHIEIINLEKGIFEYRPIEGEEEQIVIKQVISRVIDQEMIPAWEEEKTIYRYIPYTEKELSDKAFLDQGPILLTEAQETIDDLLIVVADLLGGTSE